jgi:8-oxo-dGTP pyrophosphatase MutT (NUDIX family)
MNKVNAITLRVYGLLQNEDGKLLLVHEQIGDFRFTKFPGGGLEPGEGIRDCLIREFMEEASLQVNVAEHFYTTDFFQQSAFRHTDQLISVYYRVTPLENPVQVRLDQFDIENNGRIEQMQFFWVDPGELHEDMLTFPIDKLVCRMLTAQYANR